MGLLKKIVKAVVQPAINNFKGKARESKVDTKLNS